MLGFTKMEAEDYRSPEMLKEWIIDRSQRFWFATDTRLTKVGMRSLGRKFERVAIRSIDRQGDRRSGRVWLDKYTD